MAFDRQTPVISIWTIAGGVAIGILTANAIEVGAAYVGARLTIATAQNEARVAFERAEAQKQERSAKEANELAKKQRATAEAERAEAARKFAEIEATTKHDRAWANFYKPDAVCSNPPDNATFTKCANDHIKAQRAFDSQYKP